MSSDTQALPAFYHILAYLDEHFAVNGAMRERILALCRLRESEP